MKVQKAIVLAAGLGTRLRPLTCATPKPLLPVWGEPMLARIVAQLREWGVDEIVVNCHYLHEQVESWCQNNGCRASYEPEILGTGGVLNPLRDWIGEDDFYLVNGDIVVENIADFESQASRLISSPDVIGCALVTEEGPRTIEIEPEFGYVTNWKSDEAGYPGTCTYCGFARLKAEILKYVEPSGFSSIVTAYERAMMDGRFVKGLQPKELLWTDAGTIANYIEINQDDKDNAFADFPQLAALGSKDVRFLGARGSDRVFFRTDRGVAIVYDDEKRPENARYAGHARFLKAKGIPVPEILEDRPDLKTLLMAWAGEERKMSLEESVHVVEALADFNRVDASSLELELAFDAPLYAWERELFEKHCLGARYRMEMPGRVREELENVAAMLVREPMALVHRDFQSTNVLWKNGQFSFIDFQGMRLGPAAYDLASFVYDPYVTFTEGERRALVALYAKRVGREEFVKVLPYAAVERLVQCLGAYGRLASVGQPQFGKYVLPALENLLDAADRAGLDAIGALAEDLIARETQAEHKEHQCTCGHAHHHHHDHHC